MTDTTILLYPIPAQQLLQSMASSDLTPDQQTARVSLIEAIFQLIVTNPNVAIIEVPGILATVAREIERRQEAMFDALEKQKFVEWEATQGTPVAPVAPAPAPIVP